jgi:hypothetical protein
MASEIFNVTYAAFQRSADAGRAERILDCNCYCGQEAVYKQSISNLKSIWEHLAAGDSPITPATSVSLELNIVPA